MKKRKFYKYLANKYGLPLKYITFRMNPYYIFKANVELSLEYLRKLENSMNWEWIKEDFEKDRRTEASVFYGM